MPWSKKNYPNSMKNLEEATRNKAIEIANALLEDGYEEGRAIAIATAQAKKWADDGAGSTEHNNRDHNLHVVPHPDGWAVRRVGAKRASFVFASSEAAHKKALEMAEADQALVIMHDAEGHIQEKVKAD